MIDTPRFGGTLVADQHLDSREENRMSASKRRRMRGVIPFLARFDFTRADIEAMRLSMNAFLLNYHPSEYRDNRKQRALNNRFICRRLWAIYTGRAARVAPLEFLVRVYGTAWVAYTNAVGLHKSEGEARRSAIAYTQLLIERESGFYKPSPCRYNFDQ